MRRDERIRALADVPLFSSLSSRERARFAAAAELLDVPEGTEVVREGESGRDFFLIVSGHAVVRRRGRRLATLGPGDHFGELSLLDGGPRTATVTALGPLRLMVISGRDLTAALDAVPDLGVKLLSAMAGRLRQVDRRAYAH